MMGNLLDYFYHQNYYKLISIDLLGQTDTSISQQVNITGKLDENDGASMFFMTEKQQKTVLNISLDLLNLDE